MSLLQLIIIYFIILLLFIMLNVMSFNVRNVVSNHDCFTTSVDVVFVVAYVFKMFKSRLNNIVDQDKSLLI